MSTRTRLTIPLVALACGLPVTLSAQPVAMPRQVEDVFSVEVGGSVENHSNIFRVPNGPGDTVLRGDLGLRFEREVSLQRLSAFATLQPTKFFNYSAYDYVGFRTGALWDWEIGRPVFGTLLFNYDRGQTPFDAMGAPIRNIQDILFARGLVGVRMTQAWSLISALDYRDFGNSSLVTRGSDNSRVGVEFGTRYAPGSALDVDFVFRRENAEYPYRQVFDSAGNLLPGAVDNAFSQDDLLVRVGYRPSERTRIAGRIGYARRNYENLPERNFSGIVGGMDFEWPLTGAVTMRAAVYRTIDSAELLTASYATVTGFALRPNWALTSRLSIDGLLQYDTRNYEGDPGYVFTGQPVRSDKFLDFGVRFNYEFARRVFLFSDLRHVQRSSNYAEYNFTDNWFSLGIRAAF